MIVKPMKDMLFFVMQIPPYSCYKFAARKIEQKYLKVFPANQICNALFIYLRIQAVTQVFACVGNGGVGAISLQYER